MADLTLSERLVDLSSEPRVVVDLWRDVYDALHRDGTDAPALRAAAGLSSEATRLSLTWMGTGQADALAQFVDALQAAMVEKDATDPLADVVPAARFAARFHGLARVAQTYRKTNNAARHVGALAGSRRETWRRVVRWAYHRGAPFTVAELRAAGFYERRRSSANEALTELEAHGLVEQEDGRYSLSWEGRSACRAHWGEDEIDRSAQRPGEHARALEDAHRSLKLAVDRANKLEREMDALQRKFDALKAEQAERAMQSVAVRVSALPVRDWIYPFQLLDDALLGDPQELVWDSHLSYDRTIGRVQIPEYLKNEGATSNAPPHHVRETSRF